MIPTPEPDARDPACALVDLLAVYLATAPRLHCPGCDGLLTTEVVAEYPVAAATGVVPGEAELCDRHPELAADIVAFFFLMAVASQHLAASRPPGSSAKVGDVQTSLAGVGEGGTRETLPPPRAEK